MIRPAFSLVVPLHNEAENIAALQQEIRRALAGRAYELILVDDGSTDGTAQAIERTPEVRVIAFPRNAGQSAALLAGIRQACGAVIVLMDGDLQNDPGDIPALLAAVECGCDLACGVRVRRRDPLGKKMSSVFANFLRRAVLGDGLRDSGCALKAMRKECADALVPFAGMHRFIPALVGNAGFRIVEVPVNHRPRRHGKSKYGLGNRAVAAAVDLLGVRWLQARRLNLRDAREDSGRAR